MALQKTRKAIRIRWHNILIFLAFITVSAILCYTIIENNNRADEIQDEIVKVNANLDAVYAENDEYRRIIANGEYEIFMEKRAVEDFDYAYPYEIRFYDNSRR